MSSSINLMPPATRRKIIRNRTLRLWLVIYLVLAVCLAAAYGILRQRAIRASQTRAVCERQYEPIEALKAEIIRNARTLEQVRTQEKLPLALAARPPVLSLIGCLSAAAKGVDGQVYIEHLDFRSPEAPSEGTAPRMSVRLRGIGHSDAAVTQFVEHLRSSGNFAQVEIKATLAKRVRDTVVREFQIECLFQES